MQPKLAKLFMNGGSQAVRLPAELRFEGDHVYIRRDERTGDVILSSRPHRTWSDFMRARDQLGALPDAEEFLTDRQQQTETRDPFSD